MQWKSEAGRFHGLGKAGLWAALALGLLAAAPARAGEDAAAAGDPPVILLYGDSLMAGYGLAEADGFARQLETALAARGVDARIRNASVSGDTSANGVARLDWSLAERPDAALVGLGANDMLRGLPVPDLEHNLETILARFDREHVPVLLLGMKADRGLGEDYVAAFDAVYPDLAAHDANITLYPFFLEGVALDPALNQADGLHPNARGVAEIVERIAPFVVDLVNEAG